MEQLINLFTNKYNMTPTEARQQALYYMNKPNDPMMRYFRSQAESLGMVEPAAPAPAPVVGPPGSVVMPVGGKPQVITIADIAQALPPSPEELGLTPKSKPRAPNTVGPRDQASGMPMAQTRWNSGGY